MTPAEKVAHGIAKARAKPLSAISGRSVRFDASKLFEARHALRLSLRSVGEAIGVSPSIICLVEAGCNPKLSTAMKLSAFYGVPITELWKPLKDSDE